MGQKLEFPELELPELHLPCQSVRSSEDTRDNREAQDEWESACRDLKSAWQEECRGLIQRAIEAGVEIDWDKDVPEELRHLKISFSKAAVPKPQSGGHQQLFNFDT